MTAKQKAEIVSRIMAGEKPKCLAKAMGLGQNTIYRVFRDQRGSIKTALYGDKISDIEAPARVIMRPPAEYSNKVWI